MYAEWHNSAGTDGEVGQTRAPGRAMNRLARSFALLLTFAGLLLGATDANAVACNSLATGSWGTIGTWSCGHVPLAADTVTIATGHTVTVNVATANVLSVTVNAGAILTQSSVLNSAGVLSVAGTLNSTNTMAIGGATTVTGALNITATTGTRTFTGIVTVNAGGTWNNSINELVTFRGGITNNGTFTAGTGTQTFNLTQAIGGANPINFGGIVAVVGAVTVTNNNTGGVTIAGNLTGSVAGSTWGNAANSTLNYGGAAAPMGTRVFTASAVPNTVNYNGVAAQAVKTASYNNLTVTKAAGIAATTAAGTVNVTGALTVTSGTLNIAGSTVAVTGATNVSGTLGITNATGTKTFTGLVTVNAGGTWNNSINELVTFRGGITNNGTFTAGTGTQTFNLTQAIGGANPINFGGIVAVVGAVTVTNNNTNIVTIAGNLTGSAAGSTWVNAANATLNYGGAAAPMGTRVFTASAVPNTVNYNRAGAQTAKVTTYSNLTISGSGAKTFATTPTVNGVLSLEGTATVMVTGAGVVTYGPAATLQYNKPAAYTATLEEWPATFAATGGVIIANTGAITLNAAKVLNASVPLTINSGATLANGAFALSVAGNFTQNGTFTAGAGVFTLNGGAAVQTISGTGPLGFANLTVNNTGGITLARNVTVTSAIVGAVTLTDTCPMDYTLTSSGGATVAHSCSQTIVTSINLASANPTVVASVDWTVTFTQSVTGVSASNFTLVNGGLGGAPAITLVSGSGTTWTVTASTGTGTGTLGLNMTNVTGISPAVITPMPFTGQVYSVRPPAPVIYYHDTTFGVNVGFDGLTNVTGANQIIPPIITASLNPVSTCPVTRARSVSHPAGLYTHSRWYLNANYAVATNIGANPTGSASLRGTAVTDTVIVSLYDYDPVTGAKALIGSSAPITLTGGGATTTYLYTITSPLYTVPAGHRLMLEYNFNQPLATNSARVYCDAIASFISVTETLAAPAGPDHVLITHAGSALTCSPQTVTITACANAACTTPHYAGGANVTLAPGGQTFAIDATGINSAATVQQSTAGAATLSATSVPAATSATPTTCFDTAIPAASCAMTFSDSGFVVTVPNHTSCTGATATIEAVQAAPGTGRCVPAYQNATRAVNLYSTYVSPATGTQVVTASTGVVSTAAPGTAHNLAFDVNGTATITLNYPDAGQLTLTAGDTAPTGAAMTGSSTFVAAPASFAFSAIPAAPLTAGQAFNATVTAMNACATPAATLNFNGAAALTSSNPQPGIGNATAINTTLSSFSNGEVSTNLTWNEVGTIDLNASMSTYLGWTLPTAVTGAQTGVGRFHPAYFDTLVAPGCGAFTYAGSTTPVKTGQPFTVTVKAKRSGGGATDATNTANYAGAANAYLTTLSNAGVTVGFASNTVAAASFVNGVGSANVTYEVAIPQTAPLTLTMRATDNDPTPVSSSGHTEGTADIRSGRAKISNAHGSELLALPVTFRAEYWNSGWVLNLADSCSMVNVALTPPAAWAAGVACVQDNGSPGLSGVGCIAAGPAGQQFREGGVAGFAGDFNLWLRAPGSGNTGAVTVTGNVPSWLQYPWSGGAAINPTARATFGVYKGNNEFIYLRESY